MNIITHRQIHIDLFSDRDGFHFQHEGQDCVLPSMDKVHEFFQKQSFDTLKLCHEGKKSYVHFGMDDVEIYSSKRALQRTLCQEGGGVWIEERSGKRRFFIEEKGWLTTSFKEVSKKECLEKSESTSTLTKALGVALGILALAPGVCEFARSLPFGAKEAGISLLALQQKSPFLGALGYSLLPEAADAQEMGTEFQVNTYTSSSQDIPSVAPLNDGGFVVTWMSSGQDGDSNGIYGQRYNAAGAPNGSEFQVNTYTTSSQSWSSVAPLNDGGFVVTWMSLGQDGSSGGIFGQRYNAAGAPNGSEFQVNTYTASVQEIPSVAPLNDGGFVVTWKSLGQDGDAYGIYGQRYNAAGAPNGAEFQVNTYTTSAQQNPSVAPLNDGGVVVTWMSLGQDGDAYGIYGQRYNAAGVPNGNEFQINTYTTSDQQNPSVAPLNDGGFVVTWMSDGQDGDSYGIFGQRYNATSAPNGNEFQINTYTTSDQQNPSVAPLNDGGFVVTWQSQGQDGDAWGIFGQRYNAAGAPNGSEFQVNTYTASVQERPSVAPLNDGGFVVTWESDGQDGDLQGIYGQRYDSNGTAIPLSDLPSMSSSSALSSNAGTTNVTSSQLSLTASSSGSSTPSLLPSSTTGELSNGLSTAISQSSSMGSSAISSSMQTSTPSLLPSSTTGERSNGLSTATSQLSSMGSSAISSSMQTSNQSLLPSSTSGMESTPSSLGGSSGFVIPSIIDIVYGESYPIFVNGQIVGTYTIYGGTGLLDSGNNNIVTMRFNPGHQPQEGDIVTLLEIPQGQEGEWQSFEDVEVVNDGLECLGARGEIETGSPGSSYQIIFGFTSSCIIKAPKILPSLFGIITN